MHVYMFVDEYPPFSQEVVRTQEVVQGEMKVGVAESFQTFGADRSYRNCWVAI